MARVFMTGFEAGHKDVVLSVAGGGAVSTTQKRTGDYSYRISGNSEFEVALTGTPSEIYVRFGVYWTGYNAVPCFLGIGDSAKADQLSICATWATRQMFVKLGKAESATTLVTGTKVLELNTWYCIEVHAKIDNAAGRVEVKVDGVTDMEFDGDTQATANANIGWVRFGSNIFNEFCSARGYYDDCAINDTTGARNNSWIGRGGIYGLVPNGAGTHTDFTPSAGANYAAVDEVPPDDDTTYVETSTAAHVDTYAITNLTPTSGAISAVQWVARAKLSAAGAGNFQRVLRHDGTDYNGGDLAVDTSYAYFTEIFDEAPDSTDWDITKVNALEAGMEVS